VLPELTKRFLVEIARLAGVENYPARLAGRQWKNGETDGRAEEVDSNHLSNAAGA
jgi:hypothetical protein